MPGLRHGSCLERCHLVHSKCQTYSSSRDVDQWTNSVNCRTRLPCTAPFTNLAAKQILLQILLERIGQMHNE